MKHANYFVYIMSNYHNTVIYTGVTNDLIKRAFQHKNKLVKGFTARYNVNKLVYYEHYADPISAIPREKQIKAGSRAKKLQLILKSNPNFDDLYNTLI